MKIRSIIFATRFARTALTLAVILLFVIYFVLNTNKFRSLLHIDLPLLVLLFVGNVFSMYINGIFTKIILVPFNKYIPVLESFYVSLISTIGNFFAPVGAGFGFRAVYLKRRFGLPYRDYASILSGNYILVFLVNSFFGLVALYLLRSKHGGPYDVLLAVFTAIFLVSLIFSLVRVPLPNAQKLKLMPLRRIAGLFSQVLSGWNHIISHRKLTARLVFLAFLSLALNTGMAWVLIHSIHLSVGFAQLILFSVLSLLSLFVNITPANLGVKEAIYIFSQNVIGFSTAQILSMALIDRGMLFLVLSAAWIVTSQIKNKKDRVTSIT